jgi:hypothetical protein
MEQLSNALNSIKFPEKVLMGLTFVAMLVKYFFHYQATFFMEIFAIGLTLVYFPFGFYFLGKPSENYSYKTSVVLGFIYALGILSLLINVANVGGYRYPLMADFFVLAALVIYLIFKLRADAYPKNYVNAQFIRIGFIIITSLVILLK